MDSFDEAKKNTEDMFDRARSPEEQQEAPKENAAEEAEKNGAQNEAQNVSGAQNEAQTERQLKEAAETSETAAKTALEAAKAKQLAEAKYEEAMKELEALKSRNAVLEGTIEEMSKRQEESVTEEALTPPAPNISGMNFTDGEAQRAAIAKYAEDMADYSRKQILKELEPLIKEARAGQLEKEKAALISDLAGTNEFSDIKEYLPRIENIIENNAPLWTENAPLEQKYITAYAIAKGVDSMRNPKKEPGTEELMKLYEENSDFRDMVDKRRLEEAKKSQQVPPLSASNGAVNAALNIKEKPKTFDEASERTRKMFGLD